MRIEVKKVLQNITEEVKDALKPEAPSAKELTKSIQNTFENQPESVLTNSDTSKAPDPRFDQIKKANGQLDQRMLTAMLEDEKRGKEAKNYKKSGGTHKKDSANKEIHIEGNTRKDFAKTEAGNSDKLKQKTNDIDGTIDWRKGTTLFDGNWVMHRALDLHKQIFSNDKAGSLTSQARVDFGYIRGRIFGIAEASTKGFDLGVGAQAAFEIIGVHFQFKHDAPSVKLAGRDISLHSVINADAFVGAIAEGGAILNINWSNPLEASKLEIGGEAFAGVAGSITGSTSLGNVMSAKASGHAFAGAGAKGILNVGLKDGELNVETGLGAALCAGVGYDLSLSLNLAELGKIGNNASLMFLHDPSYAGRFFMEAANGFAVNAGSLWHLPGELYGSAQKSDERQ
jgi:hypothetical protein